MSEREVVQKLMRASNPDYGNVFSDLKLRKIEAAQILDVIDKLERQLDLIKQHSAECENGINGRKCYCCGLIEGILAMKT
jgi:hypothetical protein